MDFLSAALPFISSLNANETSRMNAREARQWEEDMYNKYNSPSALVRQYQEAGINPALMFGQATPAAPTDTTPAESFATETGSVTDMLGQILGFSKLEAEIENIRAQNDNLRSQIAQREFENALTKAKELETLKNTEWIDRVNEASTEKDKASAAYHFAEAAISEFERSNGVRMGSNDTVALISAIGSALGINRDPGETVSDAIADAIEKKLGPDVEIPLEDAIGGKAGGAFYRAVRDSFLKRKKSK